MTLLQLSDYSQLHIIMVMCNYAQMNVASKSWLSKVHVSREK